MLKAVWQSSLAALLIAVVFLLPKVNQDEVNDEVMVLGEQTEILPSHFYDPGQFNLSLTRLGQLTEAFPDRPVKAGIIPHDLSHGEYIAHFFNNLSPQSPEYIILIGPNHYERGATPVITSSAAWSTPFGVVQAAGGPINRLLSFEAIGQDNQVMVDEHAIAGVMPYLKYYLPDTKVIPLILKSELTAQDIKQLVEILDQSLPDNAFLLAAVDFSHYLTAVEAEQNDQVTARAMQSFDYQKILSFGPRFNDFLDSPPSIALLLDWAKSHGLDKSSIIYNTNSARLANQPELPTTSYFEMVFY